MRVTLIDKNVVLTPGLACLTCKTPNWWVGTFNRLLNFPTLTKYETVNFSSFKEINCEIVKHHGNIWGRQQKSSDVTKCTYFSYDFHSTYKIYIYGHDQAVSLFVYSQEWFYCFMGSETSKLLSNSSILVL